MPDSIRVFILDGRVANADNADDAALWLKRGARELAAEEVAAIFGELAHLAGPHNTVVHADGSITFTPPPAPPAPTYDEQRRAAILEKWPLPAQLEALTEAAESPQRPEKLAALLADIQGIKELYPKPEQVTEPAEATEPIEPAGA
ncbi:MAG: hypothetical protein ACK5JO_07590 [Halodesulfovibrio sp.]